MYWLSFVLVCHLLHYFRPHRASNGIRSNVYKEFHFGTKLPLSGSRLLYASSFASCCLFHFSKRTTLSYGDSLITDSRRALPYFEMHCELFFKKKRSKPFYASILQGFMKSFEFKNKLF
ncbi:uncharacterized protein Gasu_59810 [Galdieria sulphuraria]|uniref:Secreted protein n=1 Tax=Galdieria sulphuraria TaxID=130081 RepID=M2X982_GALSU|nr:uncharacterized protein Gasu_59810 [Galdieria sulphuraria]EME26362.1 hypothetical protein Gasu_59810 [Galdieria sulphuraria]|eukprot:XP_005702882.1 hypothetical protein Gasu_59810 [Galdieria sulphuraria]